MPDNYAEYEGKSPEELNLILQEMENNMANLKMIQASEVEKMEKYRVLR